jgi:hypothetical protein
MPEAPLNPDERSLEMALSALVPTAPGLSRDELLYTAGVCEARRHSRRRLPLWLAAVVALSGLSGLIGAAISSAAAPPQSAVADKGAETRPAEAAVAPNVPAPVPEAPKAKSVPRIEHSFSPILDVNHWSVEQLQKHGISVAACSQWCDLFNPPKEFVTIRYDCSRVPTDHGVLMFAHFKDDVSVRSVRGSPNSDQVSLDLVLPAPTEGEGPSLTIKIWPPATEERRRARGYRLSFKRILELARNSGERTNSDI